MPPSLQPRCPLFCEFQAHSSRLSEQGKVMRFVNLFQNKHGWDIEDRHTAYGLWLKSWFVLIRVKYVSYAFKYLLKGFA